MLGLAARRLEWLQRPRGCSLPKVREGAETGYLPNSIDFMREYEVSRRTVSRDLDFLCDEERAPLEYDDAHHGFSPHLCGYTHQFITNLHQTIHDRV